MRTIKYIPKTTTANTEYRELNEEDLNWVKTTILKSMARMSELSVSHNEDHKLVMSDYWNRRRKSLPRRRDGENSPNSFIGGLANNLIFGTQRDLSDRQMEGIEQIFGIMSALFPEEFEAVRFQVSFE
jgi:hypothetical protein